MSSAIELVPHPVVCNCFFVPPQFPVCMQCSNPFVISVVRFMYEMVSGFRCFFFSRYDKMELQYRLKSVLNRSVQSWPPVSIRLFWKSSRSSTARSPVYVDTTLFTMLANSHVFSVGRRVQAEMGEQFM